MFKYMIYGLKVESEVCLKELITASNFEKADVTIGYEVVQKDMKDKVCDSVNVKFSRNEFYLYVEGVAHYYVAHGNKILVEVEEKSEEEIVKRFLLGTCFGILLSQRKTIAIHGGSVIVNGKGIIITGKTGAGKSTLTAAFRKEGYSFLSDDVSALGKDPMENVIIYPTFPQQKLCKDAIEKMGYDLNEYSLIDKEREKYSIPSNSTFYFDTVALNAIYEINIVEDEQVSVTQVFGGEKLEKFIQSIYRIETINYVRLDPDYFKKCVEMSKGVRVFQINRPKGKFTIDDQMKLIKASLT